jgi:hypothetical protein
MDELYEHLVEQVTFLRRSARAFDEGDTLEAKRLVTPIRVLVHETPRSRGRALLSQLNMIGHMTFLNTAATIDPMDMILSKSLLTVTRIGPQTEPEPRITYIAPLEKFFPGLELESGGRLNRGGTRPSLETAMGPPSRAGTWCLRWPIRMA